MNIQTNPIFVAATAGAFTAAVVVGAVSAYMMAHSPNYVSQPAAKPSAGTLSTITAIQPSVESSARSLNSENPDRFAKLEQRLDAMAASLTRSESAPEMHPVDDAEHSDVEAGADEFDIEQARAHELESWEERKLDFEREPVDRNWAFATRDTFLTDMVSIAQEKGLTVMDADCRTTQCKVVIEWPSYDDAATGFNQLLHHEYQVNCGKETLLPEPPEWETGLPYQVTMLFDCSDSRGRG